MAAIRIASAEFVTTAVAVEGCPDSRLPELAFVGRSNVGKSSLINALCQRRKLVRTSNTPGRTRALNFFRVEADDGRRKQALMLCDLPGYGFAKVSKAERAQWKRLIEQYLAQRRVLAGVVQLVDAEVGPTELDVQTLAFLRAAGRPVVVVATKLDRTSKSKRIPALRAHARALAIPDALLLGVSSVERLGLEELWEELLALAARAPAGA